MVCCRKGVKNHLLNVLGSEYEEQLGFYQDLHVFEYPMYELLKRFSQLGKKLERAKVPTLNTLGFTKTENGVFDVNSSEAKIKGATSG